MAGSLRLKLNGKAIGDVALRSQAVRELITQKTAAVAEAAAGLADDPGSVHHSVAGRSRARGYVDAPTREETSGAVLSRALGAAR